MARLGLWLQWYVTSQSTGFVVAVPGRLWMVVLLLILLSILPSSWTKYVPVTTGSDQLTAELSSVHPKILHGAYTSSRQGARPRTYHIGAVFEVDKVDNVSEFTTAFQSAIKQVNNKMPHTGVMARDVTLPYLDDVGNSINYICDAIHNNNVTVFIAVGSQKMINVLTIITKYLGIPIIGYNTDMSHMAVRVSCILLHNHSFYVQDSGLSQSRILFFFFFFFWGGGWLIVTV